MTWVQIQKDVQLQGLGLMVCSVKIKIFLSINPRFIGLFVNVRLFTDDNAAENF